MLTAYAADAIFTGNDWQHNAAVIVENGKIGQIVSIGDLLDTIPVLQRAPLLAPAFIDIQIYGAASKLFSVFPSAETLAVMNTHCNNGGTKYFLPTIATNTGDVMRRGIDAVQAYWKSGGKGVPGLHLEGPWINKVKRGAHMESFIHPPHMREVRELLAYGKGVIKMITLAPEICSREIIDLIRKDDIIISAGHSNASFEGSNDFFRDIHLATHLFNAMSALHHREPGLPAAVMLHPEVMVSIVADGYHVDFAMIRLAKKLMGERLFLITDAVTETSEGPYRHVLNGDKYESSGILSGSSLTMLTAVKNCVERCAIPLDEALRMASLYPAKVLGTDAVTGKIEEGYRADFVLFTTDFSVINCL
jgi:N-acetylglucosamine-6-phosphate deacetylase